MNRTIEVDIFAEDQAHERFLKAVIERLAKEQKKSVSLHFRQARGGHGRVLSEFDFYQKNLQSKVSGLSMPDLVVVGIDANCETYHTARKSIQEKTIDTLEDRTVYACPDPHVEVWYLADLDAVETAVGAKPRMGKRKKCERDKYKSILAKTIKDAGFPATLGGIEFAEEIVANMDFFRAGKQEKSLKHFVDDLIHHLK